MRLLVLALLVPCSLASAQVIQPVPASWLIEQLKNDAQVPGEKDTRDTLDEFRLGLGFWDSGEGEGGYLNEVAQLVLHGFTANFLGLNPTASPGGLGTAYQWYYTLPTARFDYPPLAGDDDLAEAQVAGIRQFSFQNTIFSPRAGTPFQWVPYTNLDGQIAPNASSSIRFSQNIGFANNFGFPAGEFEYNLAHPLYRRATSVPGVASPFPSCTPIEVANSAALFARHTPLNLVWPEVAADVRASIVQRVGAWPVARADFNYVAGEFATSWAGLFTQKDCAGAAPGAFLADFPETDYSPPSLVHFRAWLDRKYAPLGGLAALKSAWQVGGGCAKPDLLSGCGAITSCAAIDPLQAESYACSHAAVLADWLAFQSEQFNRECFAWQYSAAKCAQPEGAHFNYRFGPLGAERSALDSDGVALGNWYMEYFANQALAPGVGDAPLTGMRAMALHGFTYGESVNFPLFGMPRVLDAGTGVAQICDAAAPPSAYPPTYEPPCFHENLTRRTWREFLASGVDSIALAYFENLTYWNITNGVFAATGVNLAQALGAEAQSWRERTRWMTPWRSPLLVRVTGAVPDENPGALEDGYAPGRTRDALAWLAKRQVQFAPYAIDAAQEDLWASSRREVLLVPFPTDLDLTAFAGLSVVAKNHGWRLVATWDAGLDPAVPLAMAAVANGVAGLNHTRYEYDDPTTPLVPDVVLYDFGVATNAQIEAGFKADVISGLDSWCAQSFQPVLAGQSGQPTEGLEVALSNDGLNWLVSVANWSAATLPYQLYVNVPLSGLISGYKTGAQQCSSLAPGASCLEYIEARILPTAQASSILALITSDQGKVAQLAGAGFDTSAAEELLGQLVYASGLTPLDKEKLYAGLVRLRRMPFVRYDSALGAVIVHDLNDQPIANARVRWEFVLQFRTPSAIATTDAAGMVATTLAAPASPLPWDFVHQQYAPPTKTIVEIEAQHPLYASQGRALLTVVQGPCWNP